MKRIIVNSFVALSLLCTLFSCSKNDPESIFKGLNKDAISTIDMETVLGNKIISSLRGEENPVIVSIFNRVNPTYVRYTDYACVITDPKVLEGLYDNNGNLVDFSGLDFNKYSLVVGTEHMGEFNPIIGNVKAVVKDKHILLYTEIVRGHMWALSPRNIYFLSLFPKLPEYDVEVIRWENFGD